MISITDGNDNKNMNMLRKAMMKGKICVLYYATWCGYCTAMKPEWDSLQRKIRGIKLAEIESSAIPQFKTIMHDKPELVNIAGYPTIKIYNNGAVHNYAGERTAPSIIMELNNKIPANKPKRTKKSFKKTKR